MLHEASWWNLGRWRHVVGLGSLMVVAGCASDGEGTGRSTQALGASQCAVGANCELVLSFPSGIDGSKVAVGATGTVSIGSGSTLTASDGTPGAVVGIAGDVRIDASSHVGSVWTHGKAFVGSGAVISPALYAATTDVQAGANLPVRRNADGTPAKVKWTVKFPAASSGDINLEPSQTRTVAPARYGTLRVASRATLKLQTGVYYFESLQLEPDAVLQIDNRMGTSLIYVRADFTHRGRIQSLGAASDAIFGAFTTGTVEVGDELDATLVAPYAQVHLARPRTGSHDGQFFGKNVQVDGGVLIKATTHSASGPAFGSIGAHVDAASGGTLPGPVPSPNGLSFEAWQAKKNAYIQQLIDAGWRGDTVHLPPHPDAAKVQHAGDYALPSNSTLGQTAAPTIPHRDTGVFPNPGAEQELRTDINAKETKIVEAPRFKYLGQPDSSNTGTYGTPPAVVDVPKACVFSKENMNGPLTPVDNQGNPIGSLDRRSS